MSRIQLTPRTSVPEATIVVRFVRSSGPGGQNVNKVATAAELRFSIADADLPPGVRQRLERLAGNRLNQAGELVLFAQRFRTQERNRADALDRLAELVARAEVPPKARIPTRPTRAAKERRHEAKGRRGEHKRLRRRPDVE
jgi:ribosome-associated protein